MRLFMEKERSANFVERGAAFAPRPFRLTSCVKCGMIAAKEGHMDRELKKQVIGSLKYGGVFPMGYLIFLIAMELAVLALIGVLLFVCRNNMHDAGVVACLFAVVLLSAGVIAMGKDLFKDVRARRWIRRCLSGETREGRAQTSGEPRGSFFLPRAQLTLEVRLESGTIVKSSTRSEYFFARCAQRGALRVVYVPEYDEVLILK